MVNLTKLIFRVFRYNGATYDQVGSDSNDVLVAALSVDQWNTITFSSTIANVVRGDLLACEIVHTDACQCVKSTSAMDEKDYGLLWEAASKVGAGQSFGNSSATGTVSMAPLMAAPVAVGIGTSIMSGSIGAASFITSSASLFTYWDDNAIE